MSGVLGAWWDLGQDGSLVRAPPGLAGAPVPACVDSPDALRRRAAYAGTSRTDAHAASDTRRDRGTSQAGRRPDREAILPEIPPHPKDPAHTRVGRGTRPSAVATRAP